MKRVFNRIKKAYYRLFYFYFRLEKKDFRGEEVSDKLATFSALMPICVFCFGDLLTVLYVVSRFLIPLPKLSDWFLYSMAVVIIVLNFVLFFRKKRYIAIKEMFFGEEDHVRLIRSLLCIVFSLASLFTIAFLIALYGHP